ncbi:MAG: flagellar FlbD family protein [Oscillospiraceae bacterium]|nr:flagellar FlbD family protein [Oscillospiraceae bacterium]
MVKVSRLQGKEFFVNPDMIEFIEETPDVVVSMVSGKKIIVEGSAEELIGRIVEYRLRTYGALPRVIRRGLLDKDTEIEVSMEADA